MSRSVTLLVCRPLVLSYLFVLFFMQREEWGRLESRNASKDYHRLSWGEKGAEENEIALARYSPRPRTLSNNLNCAFARFLA